MLEVNDLTVHYRHSSGITEALKGIAFKIKKGDVLGIIGETGSGKTATALSVMKLLPLSAEIAKGSILFADEYGSSTDFAALSEKEMIRRRGKKIAMIFQDSFSAMNPVFTCGHQVDEVIQTHFGLKLSEAKKRTLELFTQTGLTEPERMYNSYPHQLSGGQRQRVMISMALAGEPELLIADEPTASLDVRVQADILKLLKSLNEEKKMTMIIISHDWSVVDKMTTHLAVMKEGKIVESGTTADITSNPNHSYTKALIEARKLISGKVNVIALKAEKAVSNQILTLAEPKTSAAEKKTLLKIHGLSFHYTKSKGIFSTEKEVVKALNDVSFHILKGETLGLVGESGCGKTTLAKVIVQLLEPESGEIFFDEMNPLLLDRNELRSFRRKIQMVFQDPLSSLNPKMRIGDMLIEITKVHQLHTSFKGRREKAIELLESVELSSDYLNRFPHQLSGGQQQRICIARALAPEPELIICDECVSSLDSRVQLSILRLLQKLKREKNLTYLFISHDLSVIKYLSDRILIMKEGKIIENGLPEQVLVHPKMHHTKELVEAHHWMNKESLA